MNSKQQIIKKSNLKTKYKYIIQEISRIMLSNIFVYNYFSNMKYNSFKFKFCAKFDSFSPSKINETFEFQ